MKYSLCKIWKVGLLVFLMMFVAACKKDESEKGKQKDIEELLELGKCKAKPHTSHLNIVSKDTIEFVSEAGDMVRIERRALYTTVIFKHGAYPNFWFEIWGRELISHENLLGKHIKDKLMDGNRTIIYPNGFKVTLVYGGKDKNLRAISIYDGEYYHRINMDCFVIEYSDKNKDVVQQMDERELDGETSTFDLTETGLFFYNIYIESVKGVKVEERLDLGELYIDQPNEVTDYYDDPRLFNT